MSNPLVLTPTNSLNDFNTLIQFANYLCKSEALPVTYKNSANVLVALQCGKEMGLEPMQSLRMLYIVSGNIKPWGTAYPYFLKKAGFLITIGIHDAKSCKVTATKGDESYSYTATTEDISKSSKAMSFAPKEKLYFHACSRIINYYLPEIMSGMNFENQVEDFKSEVAEIIETPVEGKSDLLKFIETEAKTVQALEQIKNQLKTPEEIKAWTDRIEELTSTVIVVDEVERTPTTSDGSLMEASNPPTNV